MLKEIVEEELGSFGHSIAQRFHELTGRVVHPADIIAKTASVWFEYGSNSS